jgi:iron complex transport system substrate-binding protein
MFPPPVRPNSSSRTTAAGSPSQGPGQTHRHPRPARHRKPVRRRRRRPAGRHRRLQRLPAGSEKGAARRGYSRVDLEAVAALKPDLVIAWESGNNMTQVDKLKALGLAVYVFQPNRWKTLPGSWSASASWPALKASPTPPPSVSATPERPAQSQCRQAQGAGVLPDLENAADDRRRAADHQRRHSPVRRRKCLRPASSKWRRRSASRPCSKPTRKPSSPPAWAMPARNGCSDWDKWTRLTAVKRGNLFHINPDIMQRHTPRILDGAEQLCAHLDVARSRRPAK